MITNKHVAIVRAALTFWDEEMATASQSTYQHYLHSADVGTEFTPDEVALVRRYFNNIELKKALLNQLTGHFDSEAPVDSGSELACQIGKQVPVVVLVPRSTSSRQD